MPTADGRFPTTSWTLIARIKSPDEAVAAAALEDPCAQYHFPLYCYLRRRGCAHHDAQDVLHDFLMLIFRRRSLERLEEKPRAAPRLAGDFARAALCRMAPERGAARAAGRGRRDHLRPRAGFRGHRGALSPRAVPRGRHARPHLRARMGGHLLRHVIDTLGARYAQRGRGALFAALRPVLEGGGSLRGEDTPALAAPLGLREDAVRAALARLLRDFRDELHSAVRLTVEHAGEVPEEMTHLMGLFRR